MFKALKDCRTVALGGIQYACTSCGEEHLRYKSCRNRHCPNCQNTQREEWIAARKEQLIETVYHHVVFTLPHELNVICLKHQRQMYSILFRTAWQTLESFGWNHKYLGAQIGATMTLHTWGSSLSYHPHVHCIVPGGGVTLRNKWKDAKGGATFLFPVKAMSPVFRAKFLEEMEKSGILLSPKMKVELKRKSWVVYSKPPFGNPETLIKYLAGYTYKTAITNRRIISFDAEKVTFHYKDYRHGAKKKPMTLSVKEFLRRLSMHFLPSGYTRIRHYGILSSTWKRKVFPQVNKKEKRDWKQVWKAKGFDPDLCPSCKGDLVAIRSIYPKRGPPVFHFPTNKNDDT
ncbi:IS91 family transposase [Saprospiraceae bacterium]|nr:IS91 family transposase [Saprospiraceae bacterium]MDB4539483.1 IS91 family transposase [Saprospiraceae bacterium]